MSDYGNNYRNKDEKYYERGIRKLLTDAAYIDLYVLFRSR